MSFGSLQAKYKRLLQENKAWTLLRADNAPYILAFVELVFCEESEVDYGQARLLLDAYIEQSREMGLWETSTNAITYLNQWIRQGWLREMDNRLSITDATQTALRFARQLEERASGTTASHLRIVQEAVRDFVVALSENAHDRIALLEAKKEDIQRQIDTLSAGAVVQLDEHTRRERIREIYQLASLLTGDFRHLEDEIRQLDQNLRVQMISDGVTRGSVLSSLMEQEELLAQTEAGIAFEGFFQLLCDFNRATEFRGQLRQLLDDESIAGYLSGHQQRFLAQLMNELNQESQRIFRIRRRTEQELRAYIESGQALENHAVDSLIARLEKLAVQFCEIDDVLKQPTILSLPTGAISLSSPQAMQLKQPDERLHTDTTIHQNSHEVSSNILDHLQTIKIYEVASHIHKVLEQQGVLSIAGLVQALPIRAGIEELVAYLRIAKAIKATELHQTEELIIEDKNKTHLKVSVPMLLLSAEMFPKQLEELIL